MADEIDLFNYPPHKLQTTVEQLEFLGRLAARMDLHKANEVIQAQIAIELRAEEIYRERYGEKVLFRGRLPDGREGNVISCSDFGWGKIVLDDGEQVSFTEMDGPERISDD